MFFMKNSIDLELWKKIQNDFSEASGMSLYLLDSNGDIIVKSGKDPYICELIKSRSSICKNSIKKRFELLDKTVESYRCNGGLTNIMIPILLNNKKQGAIVLCGIKKENDYDFSKLADDLNIDAVELRDAFDNIPAAGIDEMENYNKLLRFLVTLPRLAYEKGVDSVKINRLEFLHKISKVINSSLELEKILDFIMNILIDNIGLSSCSIVIVNSGRNRYCLDKNFIANNDIERAVVSRVVKEGEIVSVEDIKDRFKIDFVAKSIVSVPLKIKDNIIGAINMYDCKIRKEDLEFVSIIADQVALSILNAQQYKEIKDVAIKDKLTGVYNRRYFMELFDRRLENFKEAVSLILIDIDNFGLYNNDYGHLKGDVLLKGIGDILIENVKSGIIGRYGGEEFIILLETGFNKANDVAEKIRKDIESCDKFERKVTVSMGLIACLDAKMTKEEMIKEADNNLYRAKGKGKNQIIKSAVVRKNLKTDV